MHISDRNNGTKSAVLTGSSPPNEITVVFEDDAVTFPMPAAATLAELAGRLSGERRPSHQMLGVTIKLGGARGFRKAAAI